MRKLLAAAILITSVAWSVGAQQDQRPTFRTGTTAVSVDVVVRDQTGAVVRGLTAADFTVFEDGKPQKIDTFSFQEIADQPRTPLDTSTSILASVGERLKEEVQRTAGAAPAATATVSEQEASELAGRRLVVLLFDISSMQPEDVQRAVDSGMKYARETMAASDHRRSSDRSCTRGT